MKNFALMFILSVLLVANASAQDYGKTEIISWMTLAEYFPRVLNGEVADEDIEGANHLAGPAGTSEASCVYGNDRYTLTMKYAVENCSNKQTYFTMNKYKEVDGNAVRDGHIRRFTISGFTAYGEYDQFAKTATVTAYLDNCVSVCVKVSNAKGMGDAAVVFKTIEVDKINDLEP